MNPLFTYLLKSSISLILLFSLFKLTMSRDKNFQVNRFLLISIILLSSTLPFLNINLLPERSINQPIEIVQELVFPQIQDDSRDTNIRQIALETPTKKKDYTTGTYYVILFIFILRTMISLFRVMQLIGSSIKQTYKSVRIAIVKDMIQPFSFVRKIVLSEADYKENREEIVTHEMAHITHRHFIDLIICELFTLVHWFNPFAWVLRRDLKLIHEYQADQATLNKGIDATKYQLLVVKKAVGERRFAMANNFTQCPISKRLKMMNKNNFNRWMQIKLILFVPIIAFILMAFSQSSRKIIEESNVIEKIVPHSEPLKNQIKYDGFSIEIRKGGNYINGKSCSLKELANKAKAFQKTGREDILLVLDDPIPLSRVDEVRIALSNARVYHVNQTTINTDEIIYPAGDVTSLAHFSQGSFDKWMKVQLKNYGKDIPDNLEYKITISFIIDKNGKVRDGHVLQACEHPEVNKAFQKALAQIPDWEPAQKGNSKVSVYSKMMYFKRAKKTNH